MFQQLTIVGNLGQDPELRFTQNGKAVCNFSVATNRKWTGEDEQQEEETTWWRITVWNKAAEACSQYLKKGRQVMIVGRITVDKETGGPRIWTDQSGSARATLEVTATDVKFLGSPASGAAAGEPEVAVTGDEIPF